MPERARRPRSPKAGGPERLSHARHSVSVDRGFAILERFSGERESESIAGIATSIDLPRSSVHRYLQTLSVLGLVEQRGTPRRRYRLTATAGNPGIAALGATGLRSVAHDELIGLRRASGCTARLAVRLGLDALLVDQAPSFAPGQGLLGLQHRPGAHVPGEQSALRQALLSHLPVETLAPSLRESGRAAQAALEHVRKRGVATEESMLAAGVCALAVPVWDPQTGEAIAAIDLLGRAPEVTLTHLQAYVGGLQAAAERLAPAIAELPWSRWQPYRRRSRG